jgi:Nuclease-related domain
MFGKSSDGPEQDQPQHPQRALGARHRSHSAAEPRPSCSISRQHARSLPSGPAAPAQAPTDAHSSLIRSLRVWRREPEGPRALDGVCPAVGGDCRPRLCVPGSSSAGRATFLPVIRSSFPRRQRHRRLRRAAASGAGATAPGAVAIIALAAGALALAGVLALLTVGLLLDTRRWLRLAGRSRVGARSEDAVRGALAALEAEGWRVRHSLPYRGRGDIDSIAIAPTGQAFAIETKTRTFRSEHLANTREMAAWLCRYRRRWCRAGALAVLCVVGARSLERVADNVLIVSLDRLVPALRVRAGTSPRPRFLAAQESHC